MPAAAAEAIMLSFGTCQEGCLNGTGVLGCDASFALVGVALLFLFSFVMLSLLLLVGKLDAWCRFRVEGSLVVILFLGR